MPKNGSTIQHFFATHSFGQGKEKRGEAAGKGHRNYQAINGVQPLNDHHKNTWYTLISISGLLQLILLP